MMELSDFYQSQLKQSATKKKAIDYFSKKGETYKVELINDIPETEEITIYRIPVSDTPTRI
jgi:threonyl-tRNA synthetase